MGSGRTPCCSKTGLKKGPWSPGEDHRLISFIRKHGHSNWRALPKQAGLLRCWKSCRLRWINYLHPDIKRGNFTQDEEETIIKLHELLGNKWSKIASQLPGRTDNEIKNMWNTHLKKRLLPKTPNPCGDEPEKSSVTSSSSSTNSLISYRDEDIGMGNGDQAHSMFMSENPVEEYSRTILEDKEETLMDPLFDWDCLFDDKIDDGGRKNVSGIEETNPLVDDLKEISNSSNSTCGSYVTHLKQVHETIPEEQTHPQSTYEVLGEVQDTIQELNKQDHNGEILEIPFDPNINHFDMFEAALMSEIKGQKHNVSEEEESKREVESRRWVTYLENELGLQSTNDEDKEILTRATSSSGNATVLEAEMDPVAMYFHMWPHSPQNF